MRCPEANCPYTTTFGRLNMEEHLRTVHNIGPQWFCKEEKEGIPCTASFTMRKNLTKHIESVHVKGKIYDCPACPKYCTRNDHLKTHMTTAHGCKIDGCAFTGTAEVVVAHRKQTHVMCFNCQFVFATQEALDEHWDECWGIN